MTNLPKIKGRKPRSLDEALVTIKQYIPNAVIKDRKIIVPTAVIKSSRATRQRIWNPDSRRWDLAVYAPKLKAAITKPDDVRKEEAKAYTGMDANYKEYRQNDLVRACVNIRALVATNKGFNVEIFHKDPKIDETQHAALQEQFKDWLTYINETNKRVDYDNVLRTNLVAMQIHGRGGHEADLENTDGPVRRLIPLDAFTLRPEYPKNPGEVDDPWAVSSYEYNGESGHFKPEEVLYFPYNSLDAKELGLSDIEPILDQAKTKRMIMQEIIPEACTVAWAGVAIMQVDTSALSVEQEETYMNSIRDEFKPSKFIVVNHKVVRIDVVDVKPNLQGIIEVGKYLDEDIIGYFQVPPFIVGRHREVNRATAYTQLDQFINGVITELQRKLRRLTDERWFDFLSMKFHKMDERAFAEYEYRARMVWKPIAAIDFIDTGRTVAALKGSNTITQREGYRILGLNPADIEKDLLADEEMKQKLPQPAPQAPPLAPPQTVTAQLNRRD